MLLSTTLFARPIVERKTLIIALGDSTTAGTPFFRSPLEAPPDGEGDPEGQFTYWMKKKRPSWDILNYGIAGQTSTELLPRFEQALQKSPRFLIILAGVNDVYQRQPLQHTGDNLIYMYRQAKMNNVVPVAVTLPPFDSAAPDQAQAIDKLNAWIRDQAERLRIPLVDANLATRDPQDPHKLNGSPDGKHPDIGGYRSIGMKMVEAIDPVEKARR